MKRSDVLESESRMDCRLADAYRECWWRLLDALPKLSKEELQQLSNPFMVKCLPAYRKAKRKILFVGQETNGWDSFEQTLSKVSSGDREAMRDNIIEYLQWMYEDFRYHRKWDHTPFWRGARRLYKALSPDQGDDGFLHTQLVRFDMNNTRPPKHVEDLLQQEFNVLFMEIQALQPDVVIFLTGPNYDECITKSFRHVVRPGDTLTFESIAGMTYNELARISHATLPFHTYRTYHPGYSLQRKSEAYFKSIQDKLVQLINDAD